MGTVKSLKSVFSTCYRSLHSVKKQKAHYIPRLKSIFQMLLSAYRDFRLHPGLCKALLEALMMGLPCISTNCAGSDEYIYPYVNGVLVNVGDREELANKMIELLSDRNKAKLLGEEAHRNAHVFEKDNVLKRWFALINEVSK